MYDRSGYQQTCGFSAILLYLCILIVVSVFQCIDFVVFYFEQGGHSVLLEQVHIRRKLVQSPISHESNQISTLIPTPLLPTEKPQKVLHTLPMRQSPYKYTSMRAKKTPVIRKFIGNVEQDQLEGRAIY